MNRMASMSLDRDVSKDEYLELITGERLKNLAELAEALGEMSEGTFVQHVSKHHNDFADWIYDAYDEEKIARKLKKLKKKEKMKVFLEKLLGKTNVKKMQKIILPKKKKDVLSKLKDCTDQMYPHCEGGKNEM